MSQINETNNKTPVVAKAIDFLSGIKKYILIALSVLIVLLVVIVISLSVRDAGIKKATARIVQIEETLLQNSAATDTEAKAPDAELITELEAYAAKDSKWVSAKAAILLAGIYSQNKEWAKALEVLDAVSVEKASYLAPVVLFNAGSMAEEAGELDRALKFYERCDTDYRHSFPEAPRVVFSMARIFETGKDIGKAIEQYELLVDSWPEDDFSSLAKSRLIALDAVKGE
jgi:tetratricopeptide (TPR) repeat protein